MSWSTEPCVYILASRRDGVLYIGVSSAIWDRVNEHKQKLIEGFTKKYGVERLVYLEFHDAMEAAIRREKQLKKWNRAWKVRLIEQMNPEWRDLWSPTGEVFMSSVGGQAEPTPTEAPYLDERGSPPSRDDASGGVFALPRTYRLPSRSS